MVGVEGFEPPAPRAQGECADQTALYTEIEVVTKCNQLKWSER